jgi:hypothetical protein
VSWPLWIIRSAGEPLFGIQSSELDGTVGLSAESVQSIQHGQTNSVKHKRLYPDPVVFKANQGRSTAAYSRRWNAIEHYPHDSDVVAGARPRSVWGRGVPARHRKMTKWPRGVEGRPE